MNGTGTNFMRVPPPIFDLSVANIKRFKTSVYALVLDP